MARRENKMLVQTSEAGSFQKFGNYLQYYHLVWVRCLHADLFCCCFFPNSKMICSLNCYLFQCIPGK